MYLSLSSIYHLMRINFELIYGEYWLCLRLKNFFYNLISKVSQPYLSSSVITKRCEKCVAWKIRYAYGIWYIRRCF